MEIDILAQLSDLKWVISCNSGGTYIAKASLGIRLIWDLIYFWFSLNEVKMAAN